MLKIPPASLKLLLLLAAFPETVLLVSVNVPLLKIPAPELTPPQPPASLAELFETVLVVIVNVPPLVIPPPSVVQPPTAELPDTVLLVIFNVPVALKMPPAKLILPLPVEVLFEIVQLSIVRLPAFRIPPPLFVPLLPATCPLAIVSPERFAVWLSEMSKTRLLLFPEIVKVPAPGP